MQQNTSFMTNLLKDKRHLSTTWMLVVLCFLSLFLFLGDTLFNTRGEPREAVVALSMLKEGNWILPINNGVDIAYKPPFFHWLIALFSLPIGHVTEYTSRLPSALALTVMTIATFRFYAKRTHQIVALVTAAVLLTSFEVHRAGVACRVDMVLTCMMVLSLFELYKWYEKDFQGFPLCAILCLSGAFLSKGPVGTLLPLAVVAVFALVKGKSFWGITWRFFMVFVLSLVLPLAWYFAAYHEGDQRFLDLIYEENVLRLLGKMSYESHVNPWYYNVMTIVTGFLPYTLLALTALFVVKWKNVFTRFSAPHTWVQKTAEWLKKVDAVQLFTLLSFAIIFVFYCIPKSKRSVYLLPVYPFLAYYLAEMLLWMKEKHERILAAFGHFIAILSLLVVVAFVIVRCGMVPNFIVGHGKHAADTLDTINAMQSSPLSFMAILASSLPLIATIFYWQKGRKKPLFGTLFLMFALWFSLDGAILPLILNAKSDKPKADYINTLAPTGEVYSYRTDVTPGNPMHPFTINFYLGDRVVPFEAKKPAEGLLIVGNDEINDFCRTYPKYHVELCKVFEKRSCDDHKTIKIYRFCNED